MKNKKFTNPLLSTRWLSALQLLQRQCLLCHCHIGQNFLADKPAIFGLCNDCRHSLPFIGPACQQCGIPLHASQLRCGACLQHKPAFDLTFCPLTYEGAVIPLIHRFKQSHDNSLAQLFSELLVGRIAHPCNIDTITCVPMHWKKNLARGNNHSTLLARRLAYLSEIPYRQLLEHKGVNISQKLLSARQRRRNLSQAFICHQPLAGRRIAIVDDVMTTGSTLHAAASSLKAAGALEVQCWIISRTPKLA